MLHVLHPGARHKTHLPEKQAIVQPVNLKTFYKPGQVWPFGLFEGLKPPVPSCKSWRNCHEISIASDHDLGQSLKEHSLGSGIGLPVSEAFHTFQQIMSMIGKKRYVANLVKVNVKSKGKLTRIKSMRQHSVQDDPWRIVRQPCFFN